MRRMGYKEAAEMAGLSPRKIRYLVSSGELVARRCGSRVLISESDLNDWLDSLPLVVDTEAEAEAETATDDETEGVPGRTRTQDAAQVRAACATEVRQEVAAA